MIRANKIAKQPSQSSNKSVAFHFYYCFTYYLPGCYETDLSFWLTQKYRLYLKRLSAVANQQANMVAALRGRDPSYLPMGSLDGYANFNSLVASRPLPGRTSFQSNGGLPRMNSFAGFGLQGFVPSGTAQLGRTLNNTSNSVSDPGKLQGIGLPTLQGNQQGPLIQGMPAPLELDKLQQSKAVQEASGCLLGGFSSSGVAIGHSANSFTNAAKSSHIQQGNQLQAQSAGSHSHSSGRILPLSSDPFEIGIGDSSHSADLGRCNETWQGAVPSTSYPGKALPMNLPFSHNDMPSGNIRDNISQMVSQLGTSARDVSSSNVVMAPFADPVARNGRLSNVHNQASPLVTTTVVNGDASLLNFRSLGNSNVKWDDPRRGQNQNPNLTYNSSSSSSVSNIHMTHQNSGNQKLSNGFSNQKMNIPIVNQTSFGVPLLTQQDSRSDKAASCSQLPYKDEPAFEDMKLPGGFSSGGFGLDDLVGNPMIKPVSLSLSDISFSFLTLFK